MPWKTGMCPHLAGFGEGFHSSGARAELLRIRVCAGPALLSSGLGWSPDELSSIGISMVNKKALHFSFPRPAPFPAPLPVFRKTTQDLL